MTAIDDAVWTFQVQGAPVRGRYVRMGLASIDPILKRHAYPRPVAMLLGEAAALVVLVGSLLKAKGRLVIQAEGAGPVTLLVAEHRADGGVRAYARLSPDAADIDGARRSPAELLGDGMLTITLDQGPDADVMQGIVTLEGETLAACAERYFEQSEQTPTRIALAVGQEITGDGGSWRVGGALIQRIAGDAARGFTDEDWSRASILFASLQDDELLDPALAAGEAVYRLFHEDGVRMAGPEAIADRCTCDPARLTAVLSRFTAEEIGEFVEPDGLVHARCQFCGRVYKMTPEDVIAGGG